MSKEPTQPAAAGESDRWDALARFVAGECPAEEAASIRRWLAEEPARAELLAALDQSMQRLAFQPPADLDVEAALQRVSARLDESEVFPLSSREPSSPERSVLRWRTSVLRAAAAAVLLLGGALVWRALQNGEQNPPAVLAQTWVTTAGQTDSVRLADGSSVLLAPLSRLTTAAGYGAARREVELTGEALFDVVHDADRPFTVRAGNAMIRDLGTTFSVRNEAGEEVRVVVTTGSVMLHAAHAPPDSGVILRAGDRGALDAGGLAVVQRDSARESDLAWTRRRLVLDDAPLTRVATELRRWYGIELQIADSALAGRHLTATFEGESAQQVLDVIGLALPARIERRGDTAVVHALPAAGRR